MSGLPLVAMDTVNLVGLDTKSLVKKIRDLRHIGIGDSRTALVNRHIKAGWDRFRIRGS
jgi:hypothetical protein